MWALATETSAYGRWERELGLCHSQTTQLNTLDQQNGANSIDKTKRQKEKWAQENMPICSQWHMTCMEICTHPSGRYHYLEGKNWLFHLSVFIFYTCKNQHTALLLSRTFLWQLVLDQNVPKHSVVINKLFLAISTQSACIFLYEDGTLILNTPNHPFSCPHTVICPLLFLCFFVFVFSSSFFFFPLAPSIQLALQIRTKQSRSVPNTNKDHIFSTRLHAVNCQPEGKVENQGGLSARRHLTAGSQ